MIRTEELACRIRALRKQKGLTQSALAEKMDVTTQAVSKWERGHTIPDLSRVDELATVLGVDVTYLLWGNISAPQTDDD